MRRSFGHAVAGLLRSARLLGVADSALFLRSAQERKSNRDFRASHPDFPFLRPTWRSTHTEHNHAPTRIRRIHARMIADLVNQHLAGDEVRSANGDAGRL
jgi:hypothetical protein